MTAPILIGNIAGPTGPTGPIGQPGNTVASGQWHYRYGAAPPNGGEVAVSPQQPILGGVVKIWLTHSDIAGIVWSEDAVPGDALVLRDVSREGLVATVTEVAVLTPGSAGCTYYKATITQLGVIPAEGTVTQVSRVLAPQPGPPGPPGPAGPSGSGGTAGYFRHVQATASASWDIVHNLGFRPSVTIVDSAGTTCVPDDVKYLSDNEVIVEFSAAFGGEANLS